MSGPLVIGHRGASGHRPEHTASAYRLAWRMGADSVEPDVVSTRDGVLVCRHDLNLARTTDVGSRPEFAERRRRLVVDGKAEHGWFVQDFDVSEIRELRTRERWPRKRPGSAKYDGHFDVVTLEELLLLRESESARAGRRLGVHIELKHTALFERLGLPMHEPLVDLLRTHGLTSALSPASVMSFDSRVLRRLRRESDVPLVRLLDRDESMRRGRLQRIGAYASAVGLHKNHALAPTGRNGVGRPGAAVTRAFDAGLDVLVWTLRNENRHLPEDLRRPGRPRTHGDAATEVARLFDLGVDGVLTDFPETALEVRANRTAAALLA